MARKKLSITVRLTAKDREQLQREADRLQVDVETLARRALLDAARRKDQSPKKPGRGG